MVLHFKRSGLYFKSAILNSHNDFYFSLVFQFGKIVFVNMDKKYNHSYQIWAKLIFFPLFQFPPTFLHPCTIIQWTCKIMDLMSVPIIMSYIWYHYIHWTIIQFLASWMAIWFDCWLPRTGKCFIHVLYILFYFTSRICSVSLDVSGIIDLAKEKFLAIKNTLGPSRKGVGYWYLVAPFWKGKGR